MIQSGRQCRSHRVQDHTPSDINPRSAHYRAFITIRENVPNDALRPIQRQKLVLDRKLRDAKFVALDITQVPDVPLAVCRRTVILAERVEVCSGGEATA